MRENYVIYFWKHHSDWKNWGENEFSERNYQNSFESSDAIIRNKEFFKYGKNNNFCQFDENPIIFFVHCELINESSEYCSTI